MKHRAYLLIGSNLGDRSNNIAEARKLLSERGTIVTESAVYKTEPWGMDSSAWFHNQVIVFDTDLNAESLLNSLLLIEASMGRTRKVDPTSYEDRLIDLDILYFDDEVIDSATLTLPHPKITERRFALAPMVEVAPSHMHPILKQTQFELLKCCADKSFLELV